MFSSSAIGGLDHDLSNLGGKFLALSQQGENVAPVLPMTLPQLGTDDGSEVDSSRLAPALVFEPMTTS